MQNTEKKWTLPSGNWEASDAGFTLIASPLGNTRAIDFTMPDVARLFDMSLDRDYLDTPYPPEFRFSPNTGKPLCTVERRSHASWVPPFGPTIFNTKATADARGLRQTSNSLELARAASRHADDLPEASMPMPSAGDFQFFSARFGTKAPALIAFDPAQGRLFAHLPASKEWVPMRGPGKASIDVCRVASAAWRSELAISDNVGNTVAFLPTDSGLCVIHLDAAALSYEISYAGGAPVVGSPIAQDGIVWAVLAHGSGNLEFVGLDVQGKPFSTVTLEGKVNPGEIGLPVSHGRNVLWICTNGVLRLQKQADGNCKAAYCAWPTAMHPDPVFGSPYLSGNGQLWQLCFDSARETFVYVRIDSPGFECQEVSAPRTCSGNANFRFAGKSTRPPWEEPEHGDDSLTTQFVVPLLESDKGASVIGLRLQAKSDAGVEDVLHSKERLVGTLSFESRSLEASFHTLSLTEPWRLRLFVHENMLWAYHPGMRHIEGWSLT